MHSKARIVILAALILMLTLLAGSAFAVEGEDTARSGAAGARDHNGGFFMRLSAGPAWAGSEFDDGSVPASIGGTAGVDINFAFGGMITENLAIHATMWGWTLADPNIEFGSLGAQLDGTVSLSSVGGGITYYFMPVNLYFSGSVGIGALTIDTAGSSGSTDYGAVVDLTLGKEWWVSDRWALGFAGAFGFHSIPEQGLDTNWQGANLSLRFSASFN